MTTIHPKKKVFIQPTIASRYWMTVIHSKSEVFVQLTIASWYWMTPSSICLADGPVGWSRERHPLLASEVGVQFVSSRGTVIDNQWICIS